MAPEAGQEGFVDGEDVGGGFVGGGEKELAVFLDEVRVAHADHDVVVIEQDFGLRPGEGFSLGGVELLAGADPDGVAVVKGVAGGHVGGAVAAEEETAMVVKPEEVFSILAAPDEGGGAGVLDKGTAWGVRHESRGGPCAGAISANDVCGVSGDGAVDAKQ